MVSSSVLNLAAAFCVQAYVATAQAQGIDQIVGGTEVALDNYQFTASLQTNSNRHFCGASLLAPKTIVTAAHCVSNGQTSFRIRIGTTDLDGSGGIRVIPKKVFVHESYDADNIRNDIAVIELTAPVTSIPPIERSTSLTASGTATLAGWGLTVGGGSNTPRQMREAELPIVPNPTCRAFNPTFNTFLKDSMVCTGFSDGSKAACNGDSGGPLFQGTTQVGLTSWGLRGCGSYGIFTRLGSYDNWLTDKLNEIEGDGSTPSPTSEPESNACKCVGESSGLETGATCGLWGQTFNFCYSDVPCPGSTPSQRYEGFHWFRCTPSRLDIFSNFEKEVFLQSPIEGNKVENFDSASSSTVTVDNTTNVLLGVVGGAGGAFLVAAAFFVVYKNRKETSVNNAIERAEMERRSMDISA